MYRENLKVSEAQFLESRVPLFGHTDFVFESAQSVMESRKRPEKPNALGIGTNTMADVSANNMFANNIIHNISNVVYEQAKEIMFKDIIGNIVLESLYLDEDFITQHRDVILECVNQHIDANGGFSMLERACRVNGTHLLNTMKDVIVESACKTSNKQYKKLVSKEGCVRKENVSPESIASLIECEELAKDKEYLQARQELSEEEIGSFIKEKVLKVIKDEKDHEQHLNHINDEIDDLIEELNVPEEKVEEVKESYMDMLKDKTSPVDMTLFGSLMYNVVQENVASFNELIDDEEESHIDPIDTIDDLLADGQDAFGVDDSKQILDGRDIVRESATVDMDLCMAETIVKYTVLETFHTLRLEKIDREKIKEMCFDLLKLK